MEIHQILESEHGQHERSITCACGPIMRVMNSGDTLFIHRILNVRKISDQLFAAFSDEEDDSLITADKVIKGLQIIHAFRPLTGAEHHIQCMDDIIYAGHTDWELPEDVKEHLRQLGWYEDEDQEMWRADTYPSKLF